MPKPDFNMLREQLLNEGVAPRHVIRMISELTDHHEDLELEAMQQGFSSSEASVLASRKIGEKEIIAAHVLGRAELKCWVHRYPNLARLVLPVAYVALLPLAPVYAGITNAPVIARWCACLLMSALVTAAMMLLMHISIAIS